LRRAEIAADNRDFFKLQSRSPKKRYCYYCAELRKVTWFAWVWA